MTTEPTISVIIPARNEESVIAACVRSVAAQPEVLEIVVVNDQSTDRTAEIVRGLTSEIPRLRLLETSELPAGWVGKNNAVWLGAQNAKGKWLLFLDADAILAEGATAKAFKLAEENSAALVSFSPEQTLENWYEKALIPFVYCRLARKFSYADVNDPKSPRAAANGQFLLIQRSTYDAVGALLLIFRQLNHGLELARNQFPFKFIIYYLPAVFLYAAVMTASYRSYARGKVAWKGREYAVGLPNPSAKG